MRNFRIAGFFFIGHCNFSSGSATNGSVTKSRQKDVANESPTSNQMTESHIACSAAAGAIAHLSTFLGLFSSDTQQRSLNNMVSEVLLHSSSITSSRLVRVPCISKSDHSNHSHLRRHHESIPGTNSNKEPPRLSQRFETNGRSMAFGLAFLCHDRRRPAPRF